MDQRYLTQIHLFYLIWVCAAFDEIQKSIALVLQGLGQASNQWLPWPRKEMIPQYLSGIFPPESAYLITFQQAPLFTCPLDLH